MVAVFRRRWSHLASVQLSDDRAQAPKVDLRAVAHPQYHLRRAVRARLHVAREVVRREARRAEVDHLDLASRVRLDQDVLGLEVAVDETERVNVLERLITSN